MPRTIDLAAVAAALAAIVATSCTSSSEEPSEPPCVQGLTADCKAANDPPAYATIYAKIFAPTCATGSGTCHTDDAREGGLSFADAHAAYAMLLGQDGQKARVLPGDPSCSLLVKRLASSDSSYRMPRGPTPLSPAELCTITKWIAEGAKE
jgi:hypothetical protein